MIHDIIVSVVHDIYVIIDFVVITNTSDGGFKVAGRGDGGGGIC